MDAETQQKLFDYLSKEHGVTVIESDMKEIEYIVCEPDLKLLNRCQAELRACYAKLGYLGSNVLLQIDQRLEEVPKSLIN